MATTLADAPIVKPNPLPPRGGGRPSKERLEQERAYNEQFKAWQIQEGLIAPDDDDDDDLEDETPAAAAAGPAAPETEQIQGRPSTGDEWNWLSGFTPAEWERTILYLYRVEPKINRRSGGRAMNLAKYSEVIDADRVMREHGSGVYMLSVNRKIINGGRYERLGVFTFEIQNLDYPPRVPPGDWIDDPANKDWEWARRPAEMAAAAAPGADPNQLLLTMIGAMERQQANQPKDGGMMPLILALIQGQQQANDPAKFAALIKALQPADTASPMITMLLAKLERLEQQNAELMKVAYAPKENRGLAEQLQELASLKGVLSGIFGRGGAAATNSASDWMPVIEKGIEAVGPVITAIMSAPRQGPPAPPPAAPVQVAPGGAPPAMPMKPANMTAAAPPPAAPPAAAPPPAAPAPGAPGAADMSAEQLAMMQRVQPIAAKWGMQLQQADATMEHFFRNGTGYEFRDWWIEKIGRQNWDDFRADTGTKAILEMAQMSAEHIQQRYSPLFGTKDNYSFEQYLDEFFTIPGQEPAGVVEDDEEQTEELVAPNLVTH